MTECPKDFIGDTDLAKWLNKLRRFVIAIQPIESSEVAVERSHRGSAMFSKGGGAAFATQGPFQIVSVQDDYLTCVAYDGQNQVPLNADPIYICKEDKHQCSLDTETIFGVVHSYTYAAGTSPPGGLAAADAGNVFRIDSYAGNIEYQRIIPPWCYGTANDVGDIIYAIPADGLATNDPNGNPISLLIFGRSCLWGQVTQ